MKCAERQRQLVAIGAGLRLGAISHYLRKEVAKSAKIYLEETDGQKRIYESKWGSPGTTKGASRFTAS